MKLELKVAGGSIKEPGYYPALCNEANVVAIDKKEDDGKPVMLLELHCTVQYQDDNLDVKTGQYLTLGPDSKLTQLLLATGYAPDYDTVLATYAARGLDTDFFKGKKFRILYTTQAGTNGRSWVKDTGYAQLSKRPAFTGKPLPPAADDDDVPF